MKKKRRTIVVSLRHRRLRGRGFGCYFAGSVRRGKAEIHVDLDAMAFVAAEIGAPEFKRMFIETAGHEFMHALEDSLGLLFDEQAIEASIEAYRAAPSEDA